MVCEVAGIGGEGEEAGGERVRLRGSEGMSGIRDQDAGLRCVRGKQIPRFIRNDGAVFRRVVASSWVVGPPRKAVRTMTRKKTRNRPVAKRRRPLQKAPARTTGATTARRVEQKDGKTRSG